MKLKEAKKVLLKIEKLYSIMNEYAKDTHELELDNALDDERRLMIRYISKLQEAFAHGLSKKVDSIETILSKSIQSIPKKPKKVKKIVVAPKATPSPKTILEPIVVKPIIPKKEEIEPVIVQKIISTPKPEVPKLEVIKPVVPKPEITKPESRPEPKPTSTKSTAYPVLFEHKNPTELLEKLALQPIKSLNRLSPNDRIRFQKDLFEGDQLYFSKVLKDLDQKVNIENAEQYIATNLVEKFEWMEETRQNLAKDFIKLVYRRFL